jgi:hypothetical protein
MIPRATPTLIAVTMALAIAGLAAANLPMRDGQNVGRARSLIENAKPRKGENAKAVESEPANACPANSSVSRFRSFALSRSQSSAPPAEAAAPAAEKPDAGCIGCHEGIEEMHATDVGLSCVDCHGGNGKATTQEEGHVKPRYPKAWPSAANPVRSYTLLNRESPEFIRFVNPGDLRVADKACGDCHPDEVASVRKSMMTHGGMLWGAALYNNGAFPLKDTRFGESYSAQGVPQRAQTVPLPSPEETRLKGILPFLDPLPRWEVTQPGNVLRAFERGGGRRSEVGIPNRDEEPGRPDIRLSNRGFGTLLRTDPVFLGLQKTRLLDPALSFLGTNDHPGDYRSSGCSGCHVVYANDRDPAHSGPWAEHGNRGQGKSKDPMITGEQSGHPIRHQFTNAIPSSQCMTCHMHPGTNMVATYYGMTWWDNETDGEFMYPHGASKRAASGRQRAAIQAANPEGSALRGLWSDPKFLAEVRALNPKLKNTQFGDFHGHGWIFRKVYKQDRKGNLLDAEGKVVALDDPEKWAKAVHLKDIHLEKGMHCVDCHFRQDVHGNGKLYNEPRAAIEITCGDCHGTIARRADPTDPKATTTGPAGGNKFADYQKTKFGDRFFKGEDGALYQRSAVEPEKQWRVVQVADTIRPGHADYSVASHLAKTLRKDGRTWGALPSNEKDLAHADQEMSCFSCHTSWMTSCFGCHLSMTANQKTPQLHNEGGPSRNWTAYNYQVLRDDIFMLARDGTVTGNRVAPARSSSAVIVSSQNQNREWIYSQQQTVSAEGFSGQAFSTHVPHTVRGKETKQCTDCHVAESGENNAWMAQLLMLGTQFVNFMGRHVYVGEGDEGFEAVVVTEREEPQAVIGSALHRLAYPDRYRRHEAREQKLALAHHHDGKVVSLQLRGEYLYAACGSRGLVVYDVANVDNKGFSERIVTAPVSPVGQRLYVRTRNATSVLSPTTLAVDPGRTRRPENEEQAIHPLYRYLYVTDREEGLVVVDAATLLDGDPTNNFLRRVATLGDRLTGARAMALAGHIAYVACDRGIVVVDLNDPVKPRIVGEMGAPAVRGARALQVQFRYLFVCDAEGLKVLDITRREAPRRLPSATVALADARDLTVARTYAYVAAGRQGLAIVDVERPELPRVARIFDAEGALNDATAVRIAMTNASLFAYVADGRNGLRVLQLTEPDGTSRHFGFSPVPQPRLIATYRTHGPAIALSKPLDRDRAVDESGHQLAVFGRRGARPFNQAEMERLYLRDGRLYTVTNDPPAPPRSARAPALPGLLLALVGVTSLAAIARRARRVARVQL